MRVRTMLRKARGDSFTPESTTVGVGQGRCMPPASRGNCCWTLGIDPHSLDRSPSRLGPECYVRHVDLPSPRRQAIFRKLYTVRLEQVAAEPD